MTASFARCAARRLSGFATSWTYRISGVLVLPLALALGLGFAPMPARALTQGPYTLEVLVDGRPLAELYGAGRNYVEAIAGHEYSLRLTNNTGRRVGIAVSVDGLNSIDARTTTPQDGAKWILGPYESIVLDGWQTSAALARHFYFTSEKRSYGAWLGKTDNLGVIAAAVFRERLPRLQATRPARPAQPLDEARRGRDWEGGAAGGGGADSAAGYGSAEGSAAQEPVVVPDGAAAGRAMGAPPGAAASGSGTMEMMAPAPAAPPPPPPMAKGQARQGDGGFSPKSEAAPSDNYAATGIGRQVDHPIENVQFNEERKPAAVLQLRYEYRPALVRLGLLPPRQPADPLQRREHAQGFEGTFAPDPYSRPNGH